MALIAGQLLPSPGLVEAPRTDDGRRRRAGRSKVVYHLGISVCILVASICLVQSTHGVGGSCNVGCVPYYAVDWGPACTAYIVALYSMFRRPYLTWIAQRRPPRYCSRSCSPACHWREARCACAGGLASPDFFDVGPTGTDGERLIDVMAGHKFAAGRDGEAQRAGHLCRRLTSTVSQPLPHVLGGAIWGGPSRGQVCRGYETEPWNASRPR